MGRKVCIICNRYECGGYGHENIPDHEPDYMDEDDLIPDNTPPSCKICGTPLTSKWEGQLDTELYVIGGTYFDDIWHVASYDLEPQHLICIKCYNEKIKPILGIK